MSFEWIANLTAIAVVLILTALYFYGARRFGPSGAPGQNGSNCGGGEETQDELPTCGTGPLEKARFGLTGDMEEATHAKESA